MGSLLAGGRPSRVLDEVEEPEEPDDDAEPAEASDAPDDDESDEEDAPAPPVSAPTLTPGRRGAHRPPSNVPLTEAQAACLASVRKVLAAGGTTTQSTIAREMGLAPQNCVGHLRALRSKGFVTWRDGEFASLRLLDEVTPIDVARVSAPDRDTTTEPPTEQLSPRKRVATQGVPALRALAVRLRRQLEAVETTIALLESGV